MSKAGRPTKYSITYAKEVQKLCLIGATDKQLADFFEVCEDTINEWKKAHPEFSESIKRGRIKADQKVAASLFKRATGFSQKAVKIFNHEGQALIVPYREIFPPDTTAAIFWLKNRQPEAWRDKQSVSIDYERLTDAQLDAIINNLIKAQAKNG